MWTDFQSESVAVARPLPRELGQVWQFAAILAVLACGLIYVVTAQIEMILLVLVVCIIGGIVASLKVWLTSHA